jgi:hypothetical protein
MKTELQYAAIDELALDPGNPRLGRAFHNEDLGQDRILKEMSNWSLEVIAVSMLESGFWPHEAILCIRETYQGEEKLVVVEGNRRLAALKMLALAANGTPYSKKWASMLEETPPLPDLFTHIPYIELGSRKEIDAFLGFRHVTGIKEWAPAEKAEFITFLINERGYTYVEVMRKIGSKTETVRRNYIAYSILRQMEQTEGVDVSRVEKKFSVLFLSLRSAGTQAFLGVDMNAEPEKAHTPIDKEHVGRLVEYSAWLFGDGEREPIVSDSRQVDKFSIALTSEEALQYVRSMKRPNLETAYKLAGGEEAEIIDLIETAAFNIEEALSSIHLYKDVERIQKGVSRLLKDADQLRNTFEKD